MILCRSSSIPNNVNEKNVLNIDNLNIDKKINYLLNFLKPGVSLIFPDVINFSKRIIGSWYPRSYIAIKRLVKKARGQVYRPIFIGLSPVFISRIGGGS